MTAEAKLRVRAECREWLTLIQSGDASDAERARFSAWLQADPQHERAYAKLQSMWDEIGELRQIADLEPVPPAAEQTRREPAAWRASWAVATAIAALALLVVWSRFAAPPTQPIVADVAFDHEYSTAIAEVRALSLPDGSTLTLGARSRASVSFTTDQRRVRLEEGEAFFSVAQDPSKPFHVDAGNATVRVVGTRFDVHRASGRVRIAVAAGVVAVNGADTPLIGGQRIDVLANGAVTAVDTIPDSSIGAWRAGRLIYESATLADVVADIGRYRGDVQLRSRDAGVLRVTAGLRIDQIDQFLNGLPAILPVQVIRDGTSIAIDERQ